jgi:hypothetical protein
MSCHSLCNDVQELSVMNPTLFLWIETQKKYENSGGGESEI